MRAQRLGSDGLEAFARHRLDYSGNLRQLPVGKYVILDEVADAAAQRINLGQVERDAVVQHEPAWLQDLVDLAEIVRETANAHVLEHAHACDLVVGRLFRKVDGFTQLDELPTPIAS